MPKEFFASAKFQMKLPDGLAGVSGGLILPSGVARHTVERRNLARTYPHLARRLLDPQLYLSGLNVALCRKPCSNLVSYGWFAGPDLPSYDSANQTQAEWAAAARGAVADHWLGRVPTAPNDIEDSIRVCVETQARLGCEAVILPSPLTTNPGTDYGAELTWLDQGLDIALSIAPGVRRAATVAVSDTCLRGIDFTSNPLLELIADQITARSPDAVYVVLEQANEDGYYCTHPNTVGSLLRLVHRLKVGGVPRVIVAFCGTAGLLALAAGADTWSTGWYRGERRLRLVDFESQEGRARPAYYSHNLASEIHVDSDLDRIARAGYLGRIADATDASVDLLRALERGLSVSAVADWRYAPSNVAASIEHFLAVAARETAALSELSAEGCIDYVQRWLESADRLASDLFSVGSFNPRTALNHQRSWRQAFAHFLSAR